MSFEKNANTIVMNSKEYISNILDEDSYYTYATNKLIKRDIIGDIRFRENIYYNEDGLFFLDIASNLNKVVFIYPLQVYFYIQSHNNSHLQTFNERFLTIIDSFKEMEKYFEIFNESNKSYFSYRFISYYLEANYYQKKNKKIKSINNSAFKEVKKKYLNYALKSDNLSFFQKSKFVLKILFPNTVMKLKEKMR